MLVIIVSTVLCFLFIYLLYRQVKKFRRDQHIRARRYRPLDGQYDAPIFKLPNEILQQVAKTLPPGNAAAFAISCRPILFAIGEARLRVKGEDKLELFKCLEIEFPGHILCHWCIAFHRRTPLNEYHRKFNCKGSEYSELCSTRPCDDKRGFLLKDAQQIMNGYRYGPAHGPSTDQARRLTVIDSGPPGTRASQNDDVRIVGGMLLLRVHVVLHFRNDNVSARKWALNYPLRICSHFLRAAPRKELPYGEVLRKCSACGTEVLFRRVSLDDSWAENQMTRWFNFGYCQNKSEWKTILSGDPPADLLFIEPEQAVLRTAFGQIEPHQTPQPPVDDLLRRLDRIEKMIGYQEALWSSMPK